MKTFKTTFFIVATFFVLLSCSTDDSSDENVQDSNEDVEIDSDSDNTSDDTTGDDTSSDDTSSDDTEEDTLDIREVLTNGSYKVWTSVSIQFLDNGEFFSENLMCSGDFGLILYTFNEDGSYIFNTAFQSESDGNCEFFDDFTGDFIILDEDPNNIQIEIDEFAEPFSFDPIEEVLTDIIFLNSREAVITYRSM